MSHFRTDVPRSHRESQAAQDYRSGRRSRSNEAIVDEVSVHTWHAAFVDSDAEPGVQPVVETDEVLETQRPAVEVFDVERQKILVIDEHVVASPIVPNTGVLAIWRKTAEMDIQ